MQGNEAICEVIEGGSISQRKGINVPGTVVKLPAVGPRDEEALHRYHWGLNSLQYLM